MCYSRQPPVNRVELKGLRDLNTPVLPSSLSARTMGCFPPLHHPLLPPSLPTIAKSLNRQESSSYCSATSVSVRPFSLFISFCLYRPLSHLLYSLHRGESTHLPSCRATPLPSISPHSPPRGDWYQHPPSFPSSLSTPSSPYTFPPPLSFLL